MPSYFLVLLIISLLQIIYSVNKMLQGYKNVIPGEHRLSTTVFWGFPIHHLPMKVQFVLTIKQYAIMMKNHNQRSFLFVF